MGNACETLREIVTTLSEAEASNTIEYIAQLRAEQPDPILADLFAGAPYIHVPNKPFERLPPVEPIRGSGIPASELLVRDRR